MKRALNFETKLKSIFMPKPMNIYFVLLSTLAVAGAVYFVYNQKTNKMTANNQTYQILETRDFSCPGMEGFTFEYPVFRGLEYILRPVKENSCSIIIRPSDFKMPDNPDVRLELALRKISVTKTPKDPKTPLAIPDKIYQNPNGVSYVIQSQSRLFFAPDFYVDIDLSLVPNESGFSRDQFFQTVIESFKLVNDQEKLAIDLATKELEKLPRYQNWKKEGWDFQTVAKETEKSGIWLIVFDTLRATDQDITITVDVSKQSIVSVEEHME